LALARKDRCLYKTTHCDGLIARESFSYGPKRFAIVIKYSFFIPLHALLVEKPVENRCRLSSIYCQVVEKNIWNVLVIDYSNGVWDWKSNDEIESTSTSKLQLRRIYSQSHFCS